MDFLLASNALRSTLRGAADAGAEAGARAATAGEAAMAQQSNVERLAMRMGNLLICWGSRVGNAFDEDAGELGRAGAPAQVAGSRLVDVQSPIQSFAQARRQVRQAAMIEHHGGREQQCGGIRHSLAGDIGCGAV